MLMTRPSASGNLSTALVMPSLEDVSDHSPSASLQSTRPGAFLIRATRASLPPGGLLWVGQHWVKTKPLDRHQTRQCWTKGEDMLAWQGVALRVQEGLKGQSTDASWRVRGRPQRKGGVQFRNLHEVTLALARASHVGVSLGCLKIQDALH